MITRILVPTDFSAVANNALLYALNFAQKCNAKVHALHVGSIPVTDAYFATPAYASMRAGMESVAEEGFAQLRKDYAPTGLVFEEAFAAGALFEEIESYCNSQQIDMVIMGTTGASGLTEILVGSTTASVVSQSSIPVLVVPPASKLRELKKVVYATDYYEPEFPAVSRLVYLTDLFESHVTVLHVQAEYEEYTKILENFFDKNKEHISRSNWNFVKTDNPAVMDGISQFIDTEHPDLLVMAKHNRNFFERAFHRSLSRRMAMHSKIPLLVLNK